MYWFRSGLGLAAAIGLTAIAPPPTASAADATKPVAARQATMKQVALAMKTAAPFTSAKTPFEPLTVKRLMGNVATSARKLHSLYPRSSATDVNTAADPQIWQKWDDFEKRLTEMERLATLAGKANTMTDFKPAFSTLGATCKSCHDVYRKKKTT